MARRQTIHPDTLDPAALDEAVAALRAGRLVAFPTETVYGLGADARNADAVDAIFRAKGRPATNPLIVHISGVAMAKVYARRWPDTARRLAMRFWPGPLTLVVPRSEDIAPNVSAGLDTVGLRMPDHPIALALIHRFDGPLAGPSANRSTRVSPTTAGHVREELGDAVAVILDGGPCAVGIESTVLDLSGESPIILRPGGVSRRQIERVIGPVRLAEGFADPSVPASGPGQHAIHYAPTTPAYRYDGAGPCAPADGSVAWLRIGGREAGESGQRDSSRDPGTIRLPDDPALYARGLYAALRRLDGLGRSAIHVQMPPDEPAWLAVRDRLRRATREWTG